MIEEGKAGDSVLPSSPHIPSPTIQGGTLINKKFDIVSGTAFLAVGAFFIVASRGITSSSYGSNVGPSVFPTLLGILLVVLSLMVIYAAATYKGAEKKSKDLALGKLFLLIGAIILYILIFEPAGYVISTFLFLSFAFQLMERGKLWKSFLVAAVFSGAVYLVYVVLLQGTLPAFPEFLAGIFAGGTR